VALLRAGEQEEPLALQMAGTWRQAVRYNLIAKTAHTNVSPSGLPLFCSGLWTATVLPGRMNF